MYTKQRVRINLVREKTKSLGKESFEIADKVVQVEKNRQKKRTERAEKAKKETKNV